MSEPSRRAAPKTLAEAAYQKLRHDIIIGVRAPGERLRVEHLKADYQVGAGTLREALSLLVADTLVVSEGQRGFTVAPISMADMEDITRLRTILETEALAQAIKHGDEDWEATVIGSFHRLSRAEEKLLQQGPGAFDDWEERNQAFHAALISACPSRWIRHFLSILFRQSERYRRLSLSKQPIRRDVHAEHTALLEAVMERDSDRACALLASHIQLTLDSIQLISAEPAVKGPQKARRRA